MTLTDMLEAFMQRTVAYGMRDPARELAEAARREGLPTLAGLLEDYDAALAAHDVRRAAAAFALLHIFLIG